MRTRRRLVAPSVVALPLFLLACSSDDVTQPAIAGRIELAAGDGQLGEPGAPLRREIVVKTVDSSGAPLPGILVEWHAEDGGTMEPPSSLTGPDGLATTKWTLGPDTTAHEAIATAEHFPPVTITAIPALPAPPLGLIRLLDLNTYEGSNQTVHPDFATAGADWPSPRRFLAITPYPNSNKFEENPSFYESYRSTRWGVPPGGTNPLAEVTPPAHLSDPDVVFDPDRREFVLYYREVTAENAVWMMRSGDAVNWSSPLLVARAYNHELVSPSIVRRSANEWLMWSVNGNLGCISVTTEVELRRSTDGVTWSQPVRTNMSQSGHFAWHIDVQWMPDLNEYWALFNDKVDGTCNTPSLYLATSRDGMEWRVLPTPVITWGVIPEFDDIVYRASFAYNSETGVMTMWYSGARHEGTEYVWKSAVQRRLRADVLRDASQIPAALTTGKARRKVPPLLVYPP